MSVRTSFRADGLVDISVDDQRISRINQREIRGLVFQILIFGGRTLRDEVSVKLNRGNIQLIAEVISGENSDQRSEAAGENPTATLPESQNAQ